MNTQQIRLSAHGTASLSRNDFHSEESEIAPLQEGEILVRNGCIAIDLCRINPLSESLPVSAAIAVVVESRSDSFSPGDRVIGLLPWAVYAKIPAGKARKIYTDEFPAEYYLGLLGLPGLTAWFGISSCRLRSGDTLFVSDLAGEVGSVAAQIARQLGCRVEGGVNTAEKKQRLETEWGLTPVDYMATEAGELSRLLSARCPDGVDAYMEVAAGDRTEAILPLLNEYGRVVLCGYLTAPSGTDWEAWKRRFAPEIQAKKGNLEVRTISDYCPCFPEGLSALMKGVREGYLSPLDTVFEGFDKLPDACLSAASGQNIGKTWVRIGELRE